MAFLYYFPKYVQNCTDYQVNTGLSLILSLLSNKNSYLFQYLTQELSQRVSP
jgi:hypothetical protein